MSEGEHKASVQHTPAEWTSSNQDQYVNADKARYNSEKVSAEHRHTGRGHLSSAGQEPGIPPHQRHPEQNITVSPDHIVEVVLIISSYWLIIPETRRMSTSS